MELRINLDDLVEMAFAAYLEGLCADDSLNTQFSKMEDTGEFIADDITVLKNSFTGKNLLVINLKEQLFY